MDSIPTTDPPIVPPLESVLCTEELSRRPARQPDFERESRALVSLAQALADSPGTILQTLTDAILEVCKADSAGISLLTKDEKSFYWPAIAGVWKSHIGGGTPRDFGPCGDVLDRNSPLLFSHPERRYPYFQPVTPPVEEALLVPFYVEGKAIGTIWAIAHDERRKFDNEDLRMLTSLGSFAATTYQAMEKLHTLREQERGRQEADQDLRDVNEALLLSSLRQHELAEQAQQAEQKMQDSEARYRRLFETTKDGILILDFTSGKIVDANPFMKELLGCSDGDLMGKELTEIGLFSESAGEVAVRELQTKSYFRYEHLPLETRDGRQIKVEFVSNVYQVDNTSVIQCNIRDITERSRLERQTQEQAEALVQLHLRKDEFLAMLSHELRNPLSAILNALHVLRLQENENPIQHRAMVILERQVGQLAHLVDDLLEVSRVITGNIPLHQERLEMRGIVERAIESARPVIDRRKHELSVSLPAEPIWLQGDPTRLEQVVVNLINNSAKYTDDGGQISITAQQAGDEVVLAVRDNGLGITPELLPRIFDLFTQADRTLDRSQGGLGIGLSLVQKLVGLHGGTVEAHSAGLGQGSEFIVRLPALFPASESIVPPVEIAKQLTQTSRVLVVDDNKDVADMLVMILQMFGHEVRAAYSGRAALEKAVEYQPDVVLLDIGLPDMNGYEVARNLRQQLQTKDVKLIALTGYGQDSDREASKTAGFDHHLVKPVEPRQLQDLLQTLAKQPRPVK